ncbi:MAG: IMP cyclohydrolase [Solobacterium sp.]|jgi:IMP cyclohydrolase|nr:IMP cyclohydrolase [Solobacterium sp.]MCH4205895.1 IMP cyclohydrolase [Solobacterium sp.]MCH4227320.1 IMP cyclohydrolase [Solobacterium sp.]MCH4282683.1 IMP cyclohydrolase [Solobacterium sp.]
MTVSLYEYLAKNEYPGRGIAIGRTPCGKKMRIAYWIMGRSENSRNRIFAEEGNGIRTQAFDPAKLEDPSLIIYAPVKVLKDTTIVTNGDQTDTIYDFMQAGKSFEDALRTRTFEPDGPNWTPRISALVKGADVQMSILKSADGNEQSTQRQFFDYTEEEPGYGHFISTYKENGSPIPSFEGAPIKWTVDHEPFDAFSDHIWEALNQDNKVSLFTRQITIETGETETKIYNKNKEKNNG